eukprot:5400321-Pleurochrysis_carterae.AAC.1
MQSSKGSSSASCVSVFPHVGVNSLNTRPRLLSMLLHPSCIDTRLAHTRVLVQASGLADDTTRVELVVRRALGSAPLLAVEARRLCLDAGEQTYGARNLLCLSVDSEPGGALHVLPQAG